MNIGGKRRIVEGGERRRDGRGYWEGRGGSEEEERKRKMRRRER